MDKDVNVVEQMKQCRNYPEGCSSCSLCWAQLTPEEVFVYVKIKDSVG